MAPSPSAMQLDMAKEGHWVAMAAEDAQLMLPVGGSGEVAVPELVGAGQRGEAQPSLLGLKECSATRDASDVCDSMQSPRPKTGQISPKTKKGLKKAVFIRSLCM